MDRPDAVATDDPVAGRGATFYPEAFPHPIAPEYPSAADLARLVLSGRRHRTAAGAAVPAPPRRGRARYAGSASHDPSVSARPTTLMPSSPSKLRVFGGQAWSRESVAGRARLSSTGNRSILVADELGDIVGYVVLMVIAGTADLTRIAVQPDHRRNGLGRELVDEALNEAVSRGCDQVMLEVAADNVAAVNLYLDKRLSRGCAPRSLLRRRRRCDRDEEAAAGVSADSEGMHRDG